MNAIRTHIVFAGLAALINFSCHAQSAGQSHSILNRLKGEWTATGTSFGNPSDVTMTWRETLQGAFTRLDYRIIMHTPQHGDQIFEGTGLYKQDSIHRYTATWADSQGELHPISATDDGTVLTSQWGVPGKKLGKTLYRFADNETVEVVDFIQKKDGTWKEFSRNVFRRK